MKPSKKAIDFIKNEEKLMLHAYQDSAGIYTIGYGTIKYADGKPVKKGDVITSERAESELAREVNEKAEGVNRALGGVVINQNQYDALVSFAYNVGIGALSSSTLLKKVKTNPCDYSIRDEFMKWRFITKDGKKVELAGLTKRRQREAALYFSIL